MYLHRDHLGSIIAITNSDGEVIEKTHYSSWGEVAKYWDAKGNDTLGYTSILGRGYTGHEHFNSVSLIHMNGRMYDAKLRRFLSPDNFIQDPFNTQSFNRYGYVWNNPLKYNDPSGEFLIAAVMIGAFVGAFTQGLAGGSMQDVIKGFLIGAVAGLVGAGVGNVASGAAFFAKTATLKAASSTIGFWAGAKVGAAGGFAGGFTGGALGSWANGGSLGDGIAAGFKGGIIGGIAGGLISGTLGGINAKKMGLDFWSGDGTVDMAYNNTYHGSGSKVEYSNTSAKKFSNSHTELKRLSKNVNSLNADGSYPVGHKGKYYVSKNGQLFSGKVKGGNISWKKINGVTEYLNGKANVYLSESVFNSSKQLYMTMHHEYMHAFFRANGVGLSTDAQHQIIHNWQHDQAAQWMSMSSTSNLHLHSQTRILLQGIDYRSFGFKTINYLP